MQNDRHDSNPSSPRFSFWRTPLFRLLAINLAMGSALAVFLVGGLLWLDPGGLRHLIFTDRSPGIALGLLLFGFIVTLGSTAMGSAIMAMGQRERDDDAPRGGRRLVAQAASRGVAPAAREVPARTAANSLLRCRSIPASRTGQRVLYQTARH